MTRKDVVNRYFEWLCRLIGVNMTRWEKNISFRELLITLHDIEFTYIIPRDANRAAGGVDLRWRFALDQGFNDIPECLNGPCSVLEMMIALALRCEENIMDDAKIGNRTGQWFWGMITNLGLGAMMDSRFDEEYVHYAINRFLNREYEPNGRGGLFTVRHCDRDLRDVEIWIQMLWYLDNIS